MANPKPTSPVTELLRIVWNGANRGTSHSWERLNHAMRQALSLAVGAGLEFTADDFKGLSEFRYGRWIGESDEWVYSQAITEGNYSAATAFEEWKGREPIIADNVTPVGRTGYFSHSSGTRQTERLHVGATFVWKGEKVTVTSFAKGGAAIACSYHPPKKPSGYERTKVKKRYAICREFIIAERAERKERAAAEKELLALVGPKVTATQILSELGVKDRDGFAALPLKRIRAALSKFKALAA